MRIGSPIAIHVGMDEELSRAAQEAAFAKGVLWCDGQAEYHVRREPMTRPHIIIREVHVKDGIPEASMTLEDYRPDQHHFVSSIERWRALLGHGWPPLTKWFESNPDYAPDDLIALMQST